MEEEHVEQIYVMTSDKKTFAFKKGILQLSDTLQNAFEADPNAPIQVLFDEATALVIKDYLEKHEYKSELMQVKVPPQTSDLSIVIDKIAYEQFKKYEINVLDEKIFENMINELSPIIIAAESIHLEKLKLTLMVVINCYAYEVLNTDDDLDFMFRSGMLQIVEDESHRKWAFPRKLPLEFEEKLNEELKNDEEKLAKIAKGTYFSN